MEALRPWINRDHEGVVHPGQRFYAQSVRATELELAGLAVRVLDEEDTIKVVADPPPPKAQQHGTKPVRKRPVGSRR